MMSSEADNEPSTEPRWERGGLAPDVAFEILADSRRRAALRCLLDCDGPVTFEDLVSAIVDTAGDEVDDAAAHYRRVEIELHHTHLPKLGDAGVVEYHHAAGIVASTGAVDDLAPVLEQCTQQ